MKNENEKGKGKIISEEFINGLLNIKQENVLLKYLQTSKNNPLIIIKELTKYLKAKINIYEKQIKQLPLSQ